MYKQYKKTRKISKIKKSIVSALFLSGMLLLLTGCSHVTREMKESRENGIALMESGDYEGAVAEFDSLIDQTTRVTSFEIDVLKYRGEAEFMLGDYGAAAYTYDTLAKVDKPRAEYYYLGAVSLANSGDQDGAENRLESGKSADAKHEVTGYAEAMEALGAAYMTAGDEEKADMRKRCSTRRRDLPSLMTGQRKRSPSTRPCVMSTWASMRRRWSCSEATRSSMDRTRRRTMRSRFS